MSLRIEVLVGDEVHRPGGTVRGDLLVVEGGRSRSLEVRLQYREVVRAFQHDAVSCGPQRLHEGDLRTGQQFPFALQLPPSALPGHTDSIGSLGWFVVARSDEPGLDTLAYGPIVVEVPPLAAD